MPALYETSEVAALTVAVEQLSRLVAEMKENRHPIFLTVEISVSKPWIVDYQNRKHLFLWNPATSAITLSFEDYGSGPVASQQWINIGMPPGTRVLAPNNATNTPLLLVCTDEVIP